ncbi:MAG TPA: hypothetical protein VF977_13595, partial [Candidatus Binatia bacterium]
MRPTKDSRRFGLRVWSGLAAAILTVLVFSSCATIQPSSTGTDARLRQTANLVDDVKAFGITLGIEPTAALGRTTEESPALSMLWLWMQRAGTLALHKPIDIRTAIGFSAEKERLKVEQVYRVDGYSVYYRQGNEFADSRSVATIGFAAQPIVRRVMVVLHEDLHGDANFALPWEIEEAIVTPLGSLAAVAYFRQKGDDPNWQNAVESLSEERKLSRELNALASEAEKLFASLPIDDAKQKVLQQLSRYPTYRRQFERQIQGQHPPTVLEAKLSHDLAYYRFFDQIAALAELAPNLKLLIDDLKTLPPEATADRAERFLR